MGLKAILYYRKVCGLSYGYRHRLDCDVQRRTLERVCVFPVHPAVQNRNMKTPELQQRKLDGNAPPRYAIKSFNQTHSCR
jgi:hypothetical protein